MLTIFALLVLVAVVSVITAWKADTVVQALMKKQSVDHNKIIELEARVEILKVNFMKLLMPIRQNTESIDQLDDEIGHIQRLIEELKKRKELPPSSSAST